MVRATVIARLQEITDTPIGASVFPTLTLRRVATGEVEATCTIRLDTGINPTIHHVRQRGPDHYRAIEALCRTVANQGLRKE